MNVRILSFIFQYICLYSELYSEQIDWIITKPVKAIISLLGKSLFKQALSRALPRTAWRPTAQNWKAICPTPTSQKTGTTPLRPWRVGWGRLHSVRKITSISSELPSRVVLTYSYFPLGHLEMSSRLFVKVWPWWLIQLGPLPLITSSMRDWSLLTMTGLGKSAYP